MFCCFGGYFVFVCLLVVLVLGDIELFSGAKFLYSKTPIDWLVAFKLINNNNFIIYISACC